MGNKELLIIDLSTRLSYGVIVTDNRHGNSVITEIDTISGTVYCSDFDEYVPIEKCKPYLGPMSSMTDEERQEYKHLVAFSGSPDGATNFIDWLNKKMFAYRTIDGKDMFELGLALEAPKEMYNLNY